MMQLLEFDIPPAALESLMGIMQVMVGAFRYVLGDWLTVATFPVKVTITSALGHLLEATFPDLDSEVTIVSSDGMTDAALLHPLALSFRDAAGNAAWMPAMSDVFTRRLRVLHYDSRTVN